MRAFIRLFSATLMTFSLVGSLVAQDEARKTMIISHNPDGSLEIGYLTQNPLDIVPVTDIKVIELGSPGPTNPDDPDNPPPPTNDLTKHTANIRELAGNIKEPNISGAIAAIFFGLADSVEKGINTPEEVLTNVKPAMTILLRSLQSDKVDEWLSTVQVIEDTANLFANKGNLESTSDWVKFLEATAEGYDLDGSADSIILSSIAGVENPETMVSSALDWATILPIIIMILKLFFGIDLGL